MGFTFDDTDTKGVASPIAEMHRLIAKDPRNAECIFPYINGAEVNEGPYHSQTRYIINFGEWRLYRDDLGACWSTADEIQRAEWLRNGIVPRDYPELVAMDYPDLLRMVEQRVKPERMNQKDKGGREKWWLYLRRRPTLYASIRDLDRVLARFLTSTNFSTFTFLPNGIIYDQTLCYRTLFDF